MPAESVHSTITSLLAAADHCVWRARQLPVCGSDVDQRLSADSRQCTDSAAAATTHQRPTDRPTGNSRFVVLSPARAMLKQHVTSARQFGSSVLPGLDAVTDYDI